MDQPAWLDEAWREFGQAERKGAASNPRIVKLYKDAGHGKVDHDGVAWCAAFLGACLERAGQRGTRSLMARSYMQWGQALDAPRTGAVAVLDRTSNPALGHVGFIVGETDTALLLLGGNQGDAVSVAQFPKSRLLAVRWPATAEPSDEAEAAPGAGPPSRLFARALAHVLEMEGGFSNDPYDPGGPTNKGITLAVYAAWKRVALDASSAPALIEDLKAISGEDLRAIYEQRYWLKAGCPDLPAALAVMQFDTAVNHGPGTAVRILQETVGTAADGEIGPQTRAAIARMPVQNALEHYAENRRDRYRAMPHFWRFGRGWLARVDKTLALATAIAAETSPSSSDSKGQQTMNEIVEQPGKWWGGSLTIWGAVTTGLAAIVPVLGPLFGLDVTGDLVRELGQQLVASAQAVVALIGTLMTVVGRARATQPIERRPVSLRL
jgi:uncharacterized protein (TIGR02594 family)